MRANVLLKATIFLTVATAVVTAEDYDKRLTQSTVVLHEMAQASDKGIPQDLLEKAQCIVIVPGLKKIAFIGGGKYGRGFASCLTHKGWSAPAAVRVEGGSFGLQLGGSSTDVIMLVLNQGGMTKIMSDKFTLGGEAAAAAGPVGRNTSANTDVLMNAEILSWSRSRGIFAGLSLEGATLRQDGDENAKIYGKPVTNKQILTGMVRRPAVARPFLAQLQRFSGKGIPPAVVSAKNKKPANAPTDRTSNGQAPMAATATTDSNTNSTSAMDADNTGKNERDRATASNTADQQTNNKSDVDIAAAIRRSIMADNSLSSYAHNVKIIVTNGTVTLRGPVRNADEKATVESKASAIVAAGHVDDQMEIAP